MLWHLAARGGNCTAARFNNTAGCSSCSLLSVTGQGDLNSRGGTCTGAAVNQRMHAGMIVAFSTACCYCCPEAQVCRAASAAMVQHPDIVHDILTLCSALLRPFMSHHVLYNMSGMPTLIPRHIYACRLTGGLLCPPAPVLST